MPPAATMNIVNSVNLLLGLVGLLFVPGLLTMTRWGFWGTVALSVSTIAFDGVSSLLARSSFSTIGDGREISARVRRHV